MLEKKEYRKRAELLQQLPLFFQPWWLDVVAKKWELATVAENQKVIAVFPYQIENKLGIKLFRNPLLCPYLGPFFLLNNDKEQQPGSRNNWVENLLSQLPEWNYLQFTTMPGFRGSELFDKMGFSVTQRVTYLLDLHADETTIFSGFQPRLRSYIRKAEKLLRVETGAPKDFSQFFSFHQIPFVRKKTPYPFTKQLIEQIIPAAEKEDASFFQTAFDEENRPLAMLWTPFDSKSAYHLLAATNPESNVNGALALLVWKAIQFFKQNGLAVYDFEGSMDKGIAQFFQKFGGEKNNYFFIERNESLIWKMKKRLLG